MTEYAFLNMDGYKREFLISRNEFYYDMARKRLLSQFKDIESEASDFMENRLQESEEAYNPELHDPSDIYDMVREDGYYQYSILSEMKRQNQLNILAGMYHQWDKELRDWFIRSWQPIDEVENAIWKINISDVLELFDLYENKLTDQVFFDHLNACRLIVNVYKHGQGPSFDELKEKYPIYLEIRDNADDNEVENNGIENYKDHTDLNVSDDDIECFYKAISKFWEWFPNKIYASQITTMPKWLATVLRKVEKDDN